jgi:O-antigen/teichoic acid export membrane protein
LGTLLSFTGATITIAANVILIPIWGYMGSAVATLICYFSMALISYLLGKKYFPIPYNLRSAGMYIILAIILVAVDIFTSIEIFLMDYAFKFILILIYLLIIFWFQKKDIKAQIA